MTHQQRRSLREIMADRLDLQDELSALKAEMDCDPAKLRAAANPTKYAAAWVHVKQDYIRRRQALLDELSLLETERLEAKAALSASPLSAIDLGNIIDRACDIERQMDGGPAHVALSALIDWMESEERRMS